MIEDNEPNEPENEEFEESEIDPVIAQRIQEQKVEAMRSFIKKRTQLTDDEIDVTFTTSEALETFCKELDAMAESNSNEHLEECDSEAMPEDDESSLSAHQKKHAEKLVERGEKTARVVEKLKSKSKKKAQEQFQKGTEHLKPEERPDLSDFERLMSEISEEGDND